MLYKNKFWHKRSTKSSISQVYLFPSPLPTYLWIVSLYLKPCLVSVDSLYSCYKAIFHPLQCNMLTTFKIYGNKYWISLFWDRDLPSFSKLSFLYDISDSTVHWINVRCFEVCNYSLNGWKYSKWFEVKKEARN